MLGVDLHTHSTASDGTLSPRDLVRLAKDSGLAAVALTDHDTVSGLDEALAAGREFGIEVVPGCELSVTSPAGWMHIVGLWIGPNPRHLLEAFEFIHESRSKRNLQIIEKLRALGIDIDYDQVRAAARGVIGRPHISRVLMDKGVVSSIGEAFEQYLGSKGKAYVPKAKLSPQQALSVLAREGATSILAHPYLLNLDPERTEALVRELKALGLEGIEAYYTEHSPGQTAMYLDLAKRLGLLVSGGSDFHGEVKPNTYLGTGKGDLFVPYEVLERLKARRREQGRWT
ncbi:MAG: PHP domain-containing protein [Desulfovibrionaceae bacterium]|nr:PHP domain-containing protein [Desulfovibrionaceae bacterium]